MDDRRVALDTDFINRITDFQEGDPANFFCRLFQALDQEPVVHPYVAQFELMHNSIAQRLMSNGSLTVIQYSEFLPENDDIALRHYRQTFEDLYPKTSKMLALPKGLDIWSRHAKMSMGETHTILMAVTLGIPLFYSNDGGAKRGASYYRAGLLKVYNAEEVASLLNSSEQITGKERRFLSHYRSKG